MIDRSCTLSRCVKSLWHFGWVSRRNAWQCACMPVGLDKCKQLQLLCVQQSQLLRASQSLCTRLAWCCIATIVQVVQHYTTVVCLHHFTCEIPQPDLLLHAVQWCNMNQHIVDFFLLASIQFALLPLSYLWRLLELQYSMPLSGCNSSEWLQHGGLLQAIDVCFLTCWRTKLLLQQSKEHLQLCQLQNLNGSIAMRLFHRSPSTERLRLSLALFVNAQQQAKYLTSNAVLLSALQSVNSRHFMAGKISSMLHV